MNKPTTYKEVPFIIQDGLMFRDEVLNSFLSADGGIPLSTMIALAGTSGAGKTTLCKKLQKELSPDLFSTFFSLETSKNSVARQTKRVETGDNALVCDDKDFPTWSSFMKYLYEDKPTIAFIDSLQHAAKLLSKENGKYKYDNYAQIVEDLYTWKEECNTIVVMIVQLNGQGKVEGPEATVFDVDVPLKLIANPKTKERHLEASKNRNGGTVGSIYYEFVSDDRIIQFFDEDEYKIAKEGVSLPEMVTDTAFQFASAFKNHENYKSFKKDFNKEVKKIYNDNNDDAVICTQIVMVMTKLSKEYFS